MWFMVHTFFWPYIVAGSANGVKKTRDVFCITPLRGVKRSLSFDLAVELSPSNFTAESPKVTTSFYILGTNYLNCTAGYGEVNM